MKWIKTDHSIETDTSQFDGVFYYFPETAIKQVIFYEDRIKIEITDDYFIHAFKHLDKDGKSRAEEDFALFLTAPLQLGSKAPELTLFDFTRY